ncbi:hypothetical protein CB1_000869013 [Camelus ferus]|nr:hypothetical protein CB1_000869013 [Camelus ferus]
MFRSQMLETEELLYVNSNGAPLPISRPEKILEKAAHQNLASKMFCFCCKDCEEPDGIDDSRTPSQSQEFQPSKYGLQKDELDGQNPKHGDTVSRKPLGQPLIEPGKRASYNGGSEFEVQLGEKCLWVLDGSHIQEEELQPH